MVLAVGSALLQSLSSAGRQGGTQGSEQHRDHFMLESTPFLLILFIYVLLLGYAFIGLGDAPNLNMSLDYFQKQAMF